MFEAFGQFSGTSVPFFNSSERIKMNHNIPFSGIMEACRAHFSQALAADPDATPCCTITVRVLTDEEYEQEKAARRQAEAEQEAAAQREAQERFVPFRSVRAVFREFQAEDFSGWTDFLLISADASVVQAMIQKDRRTKVEWLVREGRPVGVRFDTSLGILGLLFDCDGPQSTLTIDSWLKMGRVRLMLFASNDPSGAVGLRYEIGLPDVLQDGIVLPPESEQDKRLSGNERVALMMDAYWEMFPDAKESWTRTLEWPKGEQRPLQPWLAS